MLSDAEFDRLRLAAQESLRPFVEDDQSIQFSMPVLMITATK
jgi:hypothetical protein